MAERAAGRVFGEVAEDYDRVRPGYPAALVDRVFGYGVPPGPALEMGAGTGKATVAFAGRGREITAVEPDPAMAAVLTRTAPGVRLFPGTFEAFEPDREFALLYAAEAWHWTDPSTRWANASRALAAGGVLALMLHGERVDDPAMRQAMLDVYAEFAPEVEVHDDRITGDDLWRMWPGSELAEQHVFTDRVAELFPQTTVRSSADFRAHLATRSSFRMLPAAQRDRIGAALADALDADVPIAVQTLLYLARRVG